jgi:hypothetical protein
MPVTYLLVNFLEDPNMAYNSPPQVQYAAEELPLPKYHAESKEFNNYLFD